MSYGDKRRQRPARGAAGRLPAFGFPCGSLLGVLVLAVAGCAEPLPTADAPRQRPLEEPVAAAPEPPPRPAPTPEVESPPVEPAPQETTQPAIVQASEPEPKPLVAVPIAFTADDSAATGDSDARQQKMRQIAQAWIEEFDGLQEFLRSRSGFAHLPTRQFRYDDIIAVAERLLREVGLSAENAPAACKETAIAMALQAMLKLQAADETFQKKVTDYRAGKSKYNQLLASLTKDFAGLSDPRVLLSSLSFQPIAQAEINRAFASEHRIVRQRLTDELELGLSSAARSAWEEFTLFIRYIFFASNELEDMKLGDRDDFLVYDGFEARRDAIEARIFEIISGNSKYKRAILDPPNVQGTGGRDPNRNVRRIVRERATKLAEQIRDVPTRKP